MGQNGGITQMKTRMLQILSVMMVLGLVLSACQPQVVEVEKEIVVTQVVEKEVQVEVEVEKVVEVEVEKVVEVEVEKVVEVEKKGVGFSLVEMGAAETSKVTVGIRIPNVGSNAPLYVAVDQGFYAEEGLEVEIIEAESVSAGLVGGSLQFAIGEASDAVNAAAEGTGLEIVAGYRNRQPFYVAVGKDIETPADLEGKDVLLGGTPGSLDFDLRASLMKDAGFDITGVTVNPVSVPGGSNAWVEQLLAGNLSASVFFARHRPGIIEAGHTLVLDTYKEWPNDSVVAHKDFVDANPNTVARFIRATLRGMQIWKDPSNQAYVQEMMPEYGFRVKEPEYLVDVYQADLDMYDKDMGLDPAAFANMLSVFGMEATSFESYTDVSALNLAQSSLGIANRPLASGKFGDDVTLRVMVMGNNRVEDFATNEFTMYREQQDGIHIEWEVVPVGAGPERLALTLASGDLPDIFLQMSIAPATQAVYGGQGLFLPLNHLIEEYGVNTKAMFATSPQIEPLITTPDGIIYGLPKHNECFHCYYAQKAWINIEWLDALGLDMPTTTEEFVDVLTAFKDGDPNGNGIADEIPLVGATKGWNTNLDGFLMQPFIYSEQFNHKYLILEDGVIDDAVTQDGWREGLRYLNRLFEADLFGEESFTQGNKDVRVLTENPDANLVGVGIAGAMGAISQMNSELGRWLEYRPLAPLEGPTGRRETIYNPYSTKHGECVISATSEHTVEAFRWCDELLSIDSTMRAVLGRPGIDWKWSDEGETSIAGGQALWTRVLSFGDVQNYHWAQTGPSYRSFDFRSGESAHDPEENSEVILWNETIEKMQPYARDIGQILPPLTFSEAASAEFVDLDLAIKDYILEMEAAFALGAEDIDDDAAWADYVATLEGMGIDRYVELHQEAYDQQWKGKH
mgnify:CR=1 FL=1